jgi:hypothetical protein
MRKAWPPQQADLDHKHHKSETYPRRMSASDPSYLGYWSREEVSHFLKELLEGERTSVAAYAAIGRAADSPVAELAFESELAQSAICILLKKEIAARAGAGALRHTKPIAAPSAECSFRRAIAFASRNQAQLADMIEEAVLNISDSKLNAKLMYLLLLHRKQVEHLETFCV